MSFFVLKIVKDHLHIRGEYRTSEVKSRVGLGSPPHTWRILDDLTNAVDVLRITSTYVENTTLLLDNLQNSEDHLHIRGEYQILSFNRW